MNGNKVKVFYDAEFTGLHKGTQLISIGLVTEHGDWFYAEFNDYDPNVSEWIKDNVINNFILKNDNGDTVRYTPYRETITNVRDTSPYNYDVYGNSDTIKMDLLKWLKTIYEYYNAQIQIYSDCYAYDWILFNDLICDDGHALNLPDYIYYIPMDLSTALQLKGIDPDITREEFIGEKIVNILKNKAYPFTEMGEKCKHNSLWDAAICKLCFEKIQR